MKNKAISIILCLMLMVICLTGCGNMSLGLGNYEFNKIHVDTYHFSGCIEVEEWYDNGTGIEVKTRNYGNIFLSEGTYALIAEDCPFCD